MVYLVFWTLAMLGQVSHWIAGSVSREIFIGYLTYMRGHRYNTLSALIALNVAVIAMLAGGIVEITIQNCAMAFMAGYTCDSILNKFPKQGV